MVFGYGVVMNGRVGFELRGDLCCLLRLYRMFGVLRVLFCLVWECGCLCGWWLCVNWMVVFFCICWLSFLRNLCWRLSFLGWLKRLFCWIFFIIFFCLRFLSVGLRFSFMFWKVWWRSVRICWWWCFCRCNEIGLIVLMFLCWVVCFGFKSLFFCISCWRCLLLWIWFFMSWLVRLYWCVFFFVFLGFMGVWWWVVFLRVLYRIKWFL